MEEASYFDDYDLDRKFLNLSSGMADIFANTYGRLGYRLVAPMDPDKFDNAGTIKEIAIRAMILIGAVASFCFAATYIFFTAVILGAGSKLFRALGFYFQKDGFTHIRGEADEVALINGEAKVMTWNIRGHGGGLHYAEGGVVHWKSRVDQIAEKILSENPHVIVLQEVCDTALVEALVDRLGGVYAHFYAHLGFSTWKSDNGCLVITKCAVESFSNTDFEKSDEKVRGFQTIEIKTAPDAEAPCARIIGTQLTPGKGQQETRMEQIAEIVDTVARQKLSLPTLFVGNLNLDRDSQDEGAYLSQYLYHSYLAIEPTHSDALVSQWAPIFEGQEESRDFISFFKRSAPDGRTFPVLERGIRLIDSHLVRGYDENYNTKTAVSDHHAVVTTISGLR